ncbi:hypothetical protein BVG98_07440 [Lacticaseibacillus rhamnosus]|nr:hypothetical protein BVG98_07440 [Lacticaseibacillus rhamnosus]
MKILRNYLWNVGYQLFVIIVPLVTMPYVARVLGPVGVGANSYTNSIAQYFILFGSVGVALYGSRQIAFVRDRKEEMTQTFWELTVLRSITILLALVCYFSLLLFIHKFHFYLVIQSLLIIAAAFDISWFFMGVENFRMTVMRSILARLLSLILIFTLVRSSADTWIYILIIASTTLGGNITFFPYLRRYIGRPNFSQFNILRHLRPSIALFIPQIAIQVYVVLNKTMLGSFVNVSSAGYYDSSDRIIRVVLAVVTGLGTVLLPHIANQFAHGETEKLKHTFTISMSFVSAVAIPLAFGVAAISTKFAVLFLGQDFRVVGNLLQIESIAGLFIAWDNAIGQQYLLPTNQTSKYTAAVITGAIVNILINLPLIFLFQAQGAMWATVISEFSVTAMMLWQIRKQFEVRTLFDDCPKYFFASIIMFIVVRILDQKLSFNWLSIIMEVIIGVILYGLSILFLRPKLLKLAVRSL